jgi:integrase
MAVTWREDKRAYLVRAYGDGRVLSVKSFSVKRYEGSKRKALAAAKAYETEVQRRRDRGVALGPGLSTSMTVAELAEGYWLLRLRSKARSTYDNARFDWERNLKPAFGERRAVSLTTLEIQDWQNRIGRRDTSNRKAEVSLNNLRGIMTEALKLGLVTENPVIGVEPIVGIVRPRRFLTLDQLMRLSGEFHGQDRAIILLLGLAGPRWGELVGTRVMDWDAGARRLHLTRQLYEKSAPVQMVPLKTKQSRWIGVPPDAAQALDELVEGREDLEGPLFCPVRRRGVGFGYLRHGNFSRRSFRPTVDRLARSDVAYLGLRLHDLRHTAASLWISKGASATVVAAQLGHSTAAFTLRTYAHLYEEDVSSTAARIFG